MLNDNSRVLLDLCNLAEQARELDRGNILYLMSKVPGTADDLAHALNFACSAIWNALGEYPELAEADRYRIDLNILKQIDPLGAAGRA